MSYFTSTFDLILESKDKKYTKESVQKEIERIESQREPLKIFKGLWNLVVHLLQFVIITPAAIITLSSVMIIAVTALIGSALTINGKKDKLIELRSIVLKQDIKANVMSNISKDARESKAYASYHKELQECMKILDEAIAKM